MKELANRVVQRKAQIGPHCLMWSTGRFRMTTPCLPVLLAVREGEGGIMSWKELFPVQTETFRCKRTQMAGVDGLQVATTWRLANPSTQPMSQLVARLCWLIDQSIPFCITRVLGGGGTLVEFLQTPKTRRATNSKP